MAKKLQFLLSISALATSISAQSNIRFGPYYSLGNTKSSITEATTTLYPGQTQDPQLDRLALWAGMATDTGSGADSGDLIQAIILSSNDAQAADCGGHPHVEGQWCIFASTLKNGVQLRGATVPMNATQGVTVHYLYDASTGNTTQTCSIDGEIISRLSTHSGLAKGWGTAVECQDECQGLVNAHKYQNTTIRLAAAGSSFKGSLATNNVTATALTTTDNITFKVTNINVHAYSFPAS